MSEEKYIIEIVNRKARYEYNFLSEFEAGIQLTGTIAICAWSFLTMIVLFSVLKAANVLRVSEAEEQKGLDISEHGMQAYSGAPA